MAFKLSFEINKKKPPINYLLLFSKFFHQNKEEENYVRTIFRLHLDGPKLAICETSSNVVIDLNSSFTSKDNYFRAAVAGATTAFNNTLQEFG